MAPINLALSAWLLPMRDMRAADTTDRTTPPGNKALCMPALDLQGGNCLHPRPVHYRYTLAKLGFTFPPLPLPAKKPDPQLAVVPYYYAKVVGENAPVFGSAEDAVQGENNLYQLETGFDFITYIELAEINGQRILMIAPGVWMPGSDLSRISATGSFQGLVFRETPRNGFGWVRNEIEVKRTPGYEPKDYTGQILYRYDIVQVYDIQRVGDLDWYLVGPEQWVEGCQVWRVMPNPTPPEGVTNGRWIEVNLAEQTLAVYEQSRLVFATLVATGYEGSWTRPGLFPIHKKVEAETMQG